jgi:chitinase
LVSDTFFETLDIINCAFITANSAGTLSGSSVLNNINTYIMPKARENGNWVIFSIAPSSDWSAIASSDSRINTFADNIVTMINTYGFDGVDIDWETPREDEAERFTQMMQVIYTKVKANNPNHLVTAAIAGGMWQPPRYDLVNSHQYIDYINMMTYGMVSNNGYYQNALYESRVEDNPLNDAGKTLTSCSIEESIEIYHSYGIPSNKIIVGVAFYGIKQTRTFNTSTQTWSDWANEGSVSFTYIHHYYLSNDAYDYHYDTDAGVPYLIKNDGTVFISYDNPRSIAEKAEYIIDHGLAGMMYWENGLDSSGLLLNAMQSALED